MREKISQIEFFYKIIKNFFNRNLLRVYRFFVSLVWWTFILLPLSEYLLGCASNFLCHLENKHIFGWRIHWAAIFPVWLFVYLNLDFNIKHWFLWITGGLLSRDCCIPLVWGPFGNIPFATMELDFDELPPALCYSLAAVIIVRFLSGFEMRMTVQDPSSNFV